MNAIDTHDLCLHYRGKLAIDHLTLTIEAGGIHAFVGANGAGKSSLFRVLLGFESASAGSACVLGCDSARLTPALRGRIGFVNEEHTLPSWMRVSELAAMQRRQYRLWQQARYDQVVGHFNVLPTQKIAELSRGERAGVNLALALAQTPALLILDEPTLGLDVVAKRAFLEALMDAATTDANLTTGDAATIIYCSHQIDEIERVADQLVILERGRLRHKSSPGEFCEKARLWIAEFPFSAPDATHLPGLLQMEMIDGLAHLMVFDQGDEFGARLKLLGARSAQSMAVALERAINGFLTQGHAGSQNRRHA